MADIFIPQNSAFRSILPTGTNLDNVKDKGVYALSTNNTYTNSPVAYGTLEVISGTQANNTFLLQRLTSSIGVWSRFFTGQEWKDWYQESGQYSAPTYSSGILHYALNVAPTATVTIVSMRNFGTSDLPNANYIYGMAIITKRYDNTGIQVICYTDASEDYPIIRNTHNNGTWSGWAVVGGSAPKSVTATYSTTYFNTPVTNAVEISGYVVHVHFHAQIKADIANNAVTISGLPIPVCSGNRFTTEVCDDQYGNGGTFARGFLLNNNNDIDGRINQNGITGATGKYILYDFTYIAKTF